MRADLILSGVLAVLFGFLVWEAEQWNYRSALFPQVIGVAGLFSIIVLFFVRVLLKRMPVSSPFQSGGEEPTLDAGGYDNEDVRALRLLAWIIAVVFLSWLVGQMVAMSLFMLVFLRYESKVRWRTASVSAALTGSFLYVVFDRVLNVTWLDGAMYRWLDGMIG